MNGELAKYTVLTSKFLLALGAANYILALFNINVLSLITNEYILRAVMLMIGLSGLYHLFSKQYYLPHLGPTEIHLVGKNFNLDSAGGDNFITGELTNLPPNSVVVYWTHEISFSTSGVTMSNDIGKATIGSRRPPDLKSKKLRVYYRYKLPSSNLFSQIHSKQVKTKN